MESIIQGPYNKHNIVISKTDLVKLLFNSNFNLTDEKITLFRSAFVHRSYCTRKNQTFINGNINCPISCLPLQEESNERFEYLGDAVLSLIVANYLFERFPDENEGFLTKMRTKLVNGQMLANLAQKINLQKFIIISEQIEESDGRTNKNILEDAFEAFLGAIFLNWGFEEASRWLVHIIENNIDFSDLIVKNENHKDIMIKHYQHTYGWVPRFYDVKRQGKLFYVCAKDNNGNLIGQGTGDTKKSAEINCSKIIMDAAIKRTV